MPNYCATMKHGKVVRTRSDLGEIEILVRELAKAQDRARELGIFPGDRPLLNCPQCDLEEDAAAGGVLLVTRRGARYADTGLRFKIDSKSRRAVCPGCATDFEWNEDGSTDDSKRPSEPAMRSFLDIADSWGLSEKQEMRLLGVGHNAVYRGWKTGRIKRPSPEARRRIEHLQIIFSSLHVLLRGEAADSWIGKPNEAPLFGGKSALDKMLSGRGGDILAVRRYIEAQLANGH